MNRHCRLGLLFAALSIAVPALGAAPRGPTQDDLLSAYADSLNGTLPPLTCDTCTDEERAEIFSEPWDFKILSFHCTVQGETRAFCRFDVAIVGSNSKPSKCTLAFHRSPTPLTREIGWDPDMRNWRRVGMTGPDVHCDG